jgi:hypothetical protein
VGVGRQSEETAVAVCGYGSARAGEEIFEGHMLFAMLWKRKGNTFKLEQSMPLSSAPQKSIRSWLHVPGACAQLEKGGEKSSV